MKPLIGVTADFKDGKCLVLIEYCLAVEKAGGIPLVMPQVKGRPACREMLSRLDGVLITGGPDIPPERYGQEKHPKTELIAAERDAFDFALLKEIAAVQLPVLGICYGAQALNVAFSGTLWQDVAELVPGAQRHARKSGEDRPSHTVTVDRDSLLGRILGVASLLTNSSHHQAIKDLGRSLRVVARSEDGVIEAIEGPPGRFLLGVQWHPERQTDEPTHMRLFEALVAEASK